MRLCILGMLITFAACRSGKVNLDENEPNQPSAEPSDEDSAEDDTSVDDSGIEDTAEEPDPTDIDDDGDGFTENEGDCDDADADINPDAFDLPGDGIDADCDGEDPVPPSEDLDGDGFGQDQDCNDDDPLTYPGAPEILGDGIDQDCDGFDLSDDDGDGFTSDIDCDDSISVVYPGAPEFCDGIDNDCSDPDYGGQPNADEYDDDGDGFVECNHNAVTWLGDSGVIGGEDCDDADVTVYPGAPEILSDGIDQDCDGLDVDDADGDGYGSLDDCDDTDPSLNLDDADGDGYATCPIDDCLLLAMDDTYGDGWNGGALSLYVEGVFVDDYAAAGFASSETICHPAGSQLSFSYDADNWEEENTYSIYASDGSLLFSDGPNPTEGDVFQTILGSIADCDDSDAQINHDDIDGDGFSSCADDCDDNNPLLTPVDGDGDGYSSCTDDCNDNDPTIAGIDIDGDGFSTCGDEVCYQLALLDAWNDGWSGGSLSVWVNGVYWNAYEASGSGQIETICVQHSWELSLNYTAGQWEQDNSYLLSSPDGSILFSDGPYPTEGDVFSMFAEAVIDCDDHNTSIYPGALETPDDGIDQDCNGIDLVDDDGDGDYNDTDCDDADPSLNSFDVDGDSQSLCDGDCNDNDASLNDLDLDADGFSTCDLDCDDADPTLNLNDLDGDGFSTCGADVCFGLEMQDTYGDGWNGGNLTIRSNGLLIGVFSGQGSASSDIFCALGDSQLELVYASGQWEEENTYQLYDPDGVLLFEDGPTPAIGLAFDYLIPSNADCDDADPAISPDAVEVSGDGVDSDCDGVD